MIVDRAGRNKIESVYMGGDQVRDCLSFHIESMKIFILLGERENNHAPGVLHFSLTVDALSKPCKLPPTQNSILLARMVHPEIATDIAIWILCLECD
jgi:hypothetical protein